MRTAITIALFLLPGCRGLHVHDCDSTTRAPQRPAMPSALPQQQGDECPARLERRAHWIPNCDPNSDVGMDANDPSVEWILFEGKTVTVTGRLVVDRWGWLKGGAGGRAFGPMHLGGRVELRTHLIRCDPITDECDAEGWSLTAEGTLVDAGSELAGHPIIVPNSICRRSEARPTSLH